MFKVVPLHSLMFLGSLVLSMSANSQNSLVIVSGDDAPVTSFRVAPNSVIGKIEPNISVDRTREIQDFQGALVQDALSFNLGLQIMPFEGLSLTADAWRQQVDEAPATSTDLDQVSGLPQLYIQDSAINEFNLENPLLGSNMSSRGFDLGAAYAWETERFGQFTLSSTTTYVDEFENRGSLLEMADSEIPGVSDRAVSPELQSSLMLTWQLGNHTASAITNYFDSFKDISELDINEINELVDNMTTIDLQYGYSVKAGEKDRAIISFGIRNIFNEESTEILNATTRILDQNGRVAYGSIKYQF
ncbi:MAG: outer membrane receptor protein involved in Fe transport [Pseudohongiellaceae bacterium]|jgi:outer membrane receptor protein involved in Fe transport